MPNTDTLYWIAPNPPGPGAPYMGIPSNYDLPSSWQDLNTGRVATAAPDANSTIIFGAGIHDAVGGGAAREMIAMPGASVNFESGSPAASLGDVTWSFGEIVALAGSTISGSVIDAPLAVVEPGATLELNQSRTHSPAGPIVSELVNQGTLIGSADLTLGLTSNTHPEFVQNSGELPFLSVGNGFSAPDAYGFATGESVSPFADGLLINLGSIAQGSTLNPLNIAIANYAAGEAVHVASGSGFVADLLPAPAPLSEPHYTATGTDQIGTFTPDTSQLGSHTELVEMTGGSQSPQWLVLQDRVV